MCNIIAYIITLINSFVNPSMEAVAAPKIVAVEPTSVVCFTEVEHDTLLNEVVEVATEPTTDCEEVYVADTPTTEAQTTEAITEQVTEAPIDQREEIIDDITSPEEIEVEEIDDCGHDLSEENMVTDEEPIMDEEPIIPDEPVVDYQIIEEVSDYEVEEIEEYEVEEVIVEE